MKTLYVHIGMPKTATTTIQHFLYSNRKVLNKKGYCYPTFPFRWPTKNFKRNGLFLEAPVYNEEGVRTEEEEQRRLREGMGIIRELFEKYDNVILSDEGIWLASYQERPELWEFLRQESEAGGYRVRVIAYLRRQDEFALSWWNQLLKKGLSEESRYTWKEFLNDMPGDMQLDYYEALERISGALGRENVIVRRFAKEAFRDRIVQEDFLEAVGLKLTEEFKIRPGDSNRKLSGNGCEIKRVLNEMPMSWEQNRFFWVALNKTSRISDSAYPCGMFGPGEAQEFASQFEESNRRVAADYLGTEDAPLFGSSYKELPQWQPDNPYMEADLIRFIGKTDMMLLERIGNLEKELEALRAECEALRQQQAEAKPEESGQEEPRQRSGGRSLLKSLARRVRGRKK